MASILARSYCINSLWHIDAIWLHKTGSTLTKVPGSAQLLAEPMLTNHQ